jgi:hypothetical protein
MMKSAPGAIATILPNSSVAWIEDPVATAPGTDLIAPRHS